MGRRYSSITPTVGGDGGGIFMIPIHRWFRALSFAKFSRVAMSKAEILAKVMWSECSDFSLRNFEVVCIPPASGGTGSCLGQKWWRRVCVWVVESVVASCFPPLPLHPTFFAVLASCCGPVSSLHRCRVPDFSLFLLLVAENDLKLRCGGNNVEQQVLEKYRWCYVGAV